LVELVCPHAQTGRCLVVTAVRRLVVAERQTAVVPEVVDRRAFELILMGLAAVDRSSAVVDPQLEEAADHMASAAAVVVRMG